MISAFAGEPHEDGRLNHVPIVIPVPASKQQRYHGNIYSEALAMLSLVFDAPRAHLVPGACIVGLLMSAATFAHQPDDNQTTASLLEYLSALPLGDGKSSRSPMIGSIFVCDRADPNDTRGAHAVGPWIDQTNGHYDANAKPTVDGAVRWPSRFSIEASSTARIVRGNDLPTHATGEFPIASTDDAYAFDRNPNAIRAQDFSVQLPLIPEVAAQPSCLPMGPIAFMTSGSVLFNAFDLHGRDANAYEIQDACQGHPEEDGSYHYHGLSRCTEALNTMPTAHSPLMGYALDGFGLYGRFGEAGKLLTNADLDACHGHTHALDWDGASRELYHYHATLEFPYTLGCFRGTPQSMVGVRARPPLWHLFAATAACMLLAGFVLHRMRKGSQKCSSSEAVAQDKSSRVSIT
jgi:hypothetical protein